jgi:hypothetical protein
LAGVARNIQGHPSGALSTSTQRPFPQQRGVNVARPCRERRPRSRRPRRSRRSREAAGVPLRPRPNSVQCPRREGARRDRSKGPMIVRNVAVALAWAGARGRACKLAAMTTYLEMTLAKSVAKRNSSARSCTMSRRSPAAPSRSATPLETARTPWEARRSRLRRALPNGELLP